MLESPRTSANNQMQRTPRSRLGCILNIIGAGSLIWNVRPLAPAVKTQDFTVTEFVGHWRARWGVFCADWILRSDSALAGKISVLSIPILRLTGTWSIDGDKLVSIYDKNFFIPSGKDTDRLLEVAQDYFILLTSIGTRRRWERVYERRLA
ncbi:MAG: hypothetical protein JWM68_648 [Verrucomicrobiales bacterium]|nr:hypothetical protein [Verrucomicrobiales bacterium]